MGRKRKAGKRYTSGKSKGRLIVEQRDKGNERAAARLEYWNAMCWQGGGHGRHSDCPVGLLWLTYHLDGHDVPGEELLAAFDLFVELRRSKFGASSAKAIDYTPKTRTTGSDDGNPKAVGLFNRLNEALREDYAASKAIESLMYDKPFCRDTEDQVPHWVQRLADEVRVGKGHRMDKLVRMPSKFDRDRLDAAVKGLSLIVAAMGGKIRKDKAA